MNVELLDGNYWVSDVAMPNDKYLVEYVHEGVWKCHSCKSFQCVHVAAVAQRTEWTKNGYCVLI